MNHLPGPVGELLNNLSEAEIEKAWKQTICGVKFHYLNPRVEDINIRDIAYGLSNTCRYNGQCKRFYSVSQHSVLMSRHVPIHLAFEALMHDATEAYIGDMATPLKRIMPGFKIIEGLIFEVIVEKFGLPTKPSLEIKKMDKILLATEKKYLLGPEPAPWPAFDGKKPEVLNIRIWPWPAMWARWMFMRRFRYLLNVRRNL